MLTRLEIDGFKNLLGFEADFGPYTCIAGPNAVGKSNIFDAIRFLSMLADTTFIEAASRVRAIDGGPPDLSLLFWDGAKPGEPRKMRLAAEMIVPREVTDDFGRLGATTTTYLRYELELEDVPTAVESHGRTGGIRLLHESLTSLTTDIPGKRMPWLRRRDKFRQALITSGSEGTDLISTLTEDDGEVAVLVHPDGHDGRPQKSPARRAPRTAVSTTTTIEAPTILAARNEMRLWSLLALEPSAMRQPDEVTSPTTISENGAHMASALSRMAALDDGAAYERVKATASGLTDVREVDVDSDEKRELLTLYAGIGPGRTVPARNLSDGTLRFLALCIMVEDPDFGGVICMEEPENGIHPARMRAMVDLVRSLAVDPDEPLDSANPVRQVIVNTHSPRFVSMQNAEDLVLALNTTVTRANRAATTLRLHPMRGSWRAERARLALSKADVEAYLVTQDDDQLVVDLTTGTGADA
ncbi:putative ATPase [Promicromonospora sp. AC04]|uniref:AAA family ATPase n=1 Tax=Promicromonospora sp. AC04 TaxID=2135723 RepID=UPI000D3A695E|nr:AAA family ATPase [Promicromonospora sp. AC04]PUB21468.1 putative ATPase [Promicromonospora sp. AC04]